MKKLFFPLLALISIGAKAQTATAEHVCEVSLATTADNDTLYTTKFVLFVPEGPAKSTSAFSFSKSKYGVTLDIVANSPSPKTYAANSLFLFTLNDGTEFFVSMGDKDVVSEYKESTGKYASMFFINLNDETIKKIQSVGLKDIRLGKDQYAGGFYLQPLAKKIFMEDLNCIVAKKLKK